MTDDLTRLLAALNTAADPAPVRAQLAAGLDDALDLDREPAGRGRPPALSPAQVRYARKQRAKPLAERPRLVELAAEFRVHVVTIRKALQARPPYDWGEPAPSAGGKHRDRGSQRFPP